MFGTTKTVYRETHVSRPRTGNGVKSGVYSYFVFEQRTYPRRQLADSERMFVYRRARSLLTGPCVYAVRVYQTILRAQSRATGKRGLMSPDQSPLRQSPAKRCAPCRAKAPFTSVRKRVCRAFYVFADRLSAHFECPVLSVSTQGVSSPPPRANGNYGIG